MKRKIILLPLIVLILSLFQGVCLAAEAEVQQDIRVGLFYEDTALKEVKLTTGENFFLGEEIEVSKKVTAHFVYETGGMRVVNSLGEVVLEAEKDEAVNIAAEDGVVVFGERKYRRQLELTATSKGIRVVNILPLDEYLYGVLPNEIYPSWPEEALKTTAVASRSFTLASISGKHSAHGFDVCNNTHCQMYRGMGTEYASTNKAVDDTKGQVLTYNGKIISAMYSANNGGYCEGTENIWSAKLPYYVSKPDPYTPEDVWKVSFTASEVNEKLKARGKDIGDIKRIVVEKVAESGRVTKLTIVGTNGKYTLEKDSIRSLFGLRSTMFELYTSNTASKSLAEAVIAMENSADIGLCLAAFTRGEATYIFEGRGYGHGAGISQWGCKNMADMGFNYEEILAFYYEGAVLQKPEITDSEDTEQPEETLEENYEGI